MGIKRQVKRKIDMDMTVPLLGLILLIIVLSFFAPTED